METVSETACCRGRVGFYAHESASLGLQTKFGVFLPESALGGRKVPVIHVLAGLTCTEETFFIKANALKFAAKHEVALVATDTSPRGAGVPGEDESYDLGTAAGFYLDATQAPWSKHYKMGSWISSELPALTEKAFPLDGDRRGIMGHSMGGHGALVHALKAPDFWKSVSAFAPIVHPAAVPWGEKGFSAYLGDDRTHWAAWDATELLLAGKMHPTTLLVDQGLGDQFLERELQPHHLEDAAKKVGQRVRLRQHAGYDHSYWFIQSFIEDHLAHHAAILKG